MPLSERSASHAARGSTILVRSDDGGNTERVQILSRMDVLLAGNDLRHKFGALERSGADPGGGWKDALTHMDEFGSHVRSVFGADAIEGDAAAFFARASQTLGELQRVDAGPRPAAGRPGTTPRLGDPMDADRAGRRRAGRCC